MQHNPDDDGSAQCFFPFTLTHDIYHTQRAGHLSRHSIDLASFATLADMLVGMQDKLNMDLSIT